MPQLSAHWPFSPKNAPFFYGWVIWLLSTLGVLFSIPGQVAGTTCTARNVLLLWFIRRRGLVSGVRGVFLSLGFSLAPLLLGWMILTFGWRESLWIMAVWVSLGLLIVLLMVALWGRQEEVIHAKHG